MKVVYNDAGKMRGTVDKTAETQGKSRLQFRNYYIKIIFIKINFVNVKEEIFNA